MEQNAQVFNLGNKCRLVEMERASSLYREKLVKCVRNPIAGSPQEREMPGDTHREDEKREEKAVMRDDLSYCRDR